MFFEACDICNPVSVVLNLDIFKMGIQIAITIPSKSNQLRNVNTVRSESGNVYTQPWVINNKKSEVIAFVVNAGMSLPITLIFKSKKEVSLSEVFALFKASAHSFKRFT